MFWFLILDAALAKLPQFCYYQNKECGGHGTCQQTDGVYTCICDEGCTLSPSMLCVPEVCYNPQYNLLCPNGECVKTGGSYHCECPSGLTAIGSQCAADVCITTINGVQTACSGHGTCLYNGYSAYYCGCEQHYSDHKLCTTCNLNYGAIINGECYPLKCIQKTTQGDSVLCNNCGTCSFSATGMINARKWHCVCDDKCKAKDGQCLSNSCVSDNYETYCGNAGVCTPSGCLCNSGFSGDKCTHNDADPGACPPNQTRVDGTCYPDRCLTKTDPPMVCGIQGAGECLYFDLEDAFVCKCNDGALSTDVYPCIPTGCYVDNQMCPNGKCIAESSGSGYKYHCECDDGFITRNNSCLPPSCFVSLSDGSTLECSGHGTCRTFGCDCDFAFAGPHCENFSGHCHPGFVFINYEVGCVAKECITYNPDRRVCGGFGKCVSDRGSYKCQCDAETVSDKDYICVSSYCRNENGAVCPSMSCVKLPSGKGQCGCPQDYSVYNGQCFPNVCITGNSLCSGNGRCNVDAGTCACIIGYSGASCSSCASGYQDVAGMGCISRGCIANGVICSNVGTCYGSGCQCPSGYRPNGPSCVVSGSSGPGLSKGAKVGIGMGCVIVISGVGLAIFFILKRKCKKAEVPADEEAQRLLDPEMSVEDVI
ncbi:High cysteine membrane protein [Giardia muris]|uniref:High cysteine membrane protein n=1 Tax=Giardia muris TaxID=5742 RepID=A0A4Z1T4I2_GIAMU|nr:High cysteine membrane protein [Giardia muris]|eukprot:TNJ27967.1 High cysteine membrane protein [Giardia muris]